MVNLEIIILQSAVLIAAIGAFILFVNSKSLFSKNKQLKSDMGKLLLAIKRVRYGDINVRLDNLNDKELENAVNRLFETMYDREMMIKEYQATLSNKNLSLEEILKQEKQLQLFKEDFAATLTHDMKVPVIAELNSLNYLLEGRFGNLNEKQAEILQLMKSSNQELKDLIENMIETYRLEQKSLNINKTLQNINPFIFEIAEEMKPIALQTSHNIKINLADTENINVNFDSFQLKRVIKNLLQNAISFSPNSTDIQLTSSKGENYIKILFTNKGSGISVEDLNLIFQKYYYGHSKFRKAGTGLGLYLSQQIVIAHDGNIEVDTSKNGYTTFILKLPI